jgi:hypothetical protein
MKNLIKRKVNDDSLKANHSLEILKFCSDYISNNTTTKKILENIIQIIVNILNSSLLESNSIFYLKPIESIIDELLNHFIGKINSSTNVSSFLAYIKVIDAIFQTEMISEKNVVAITKSTLGFIEEILKKILDTYGNFDITNNLQGFLES